MSDATFFFGGWEPLLRIVIVGTLGYMALVILLRVSKKRTLSQMNAFDFIVTVALGASFGRVLTAHHVALAEAITAFCLLVFLQFLVSFLQVRSPTFSKLVTNPPTLLLYKGAILHDALRQQRVVEAELMTALRQKGVRSVKEVEAVVLEPNGNFSVVKKGEEGDCSTLRSVTEPEN